MLHGATHFCVVENGKTKTSPALALLNVDSMDSIYDFCRSIATAPRQVGVSHARLLFAMGSHSPGLWSCLDAETILSLESGLVRVLRLLRYIPPNQT